MIDLIYSILKLVMMLVLIGVVGSIIHYLSRWFNNWRAYLDHHIKGQTETNEQLKKSVDSIMATTETIVQFVESAKEESRLLRQMTFETHHWQRKAEVIHRKHIKRTAINEDKIQEVDHRVKRLEKKHGNDTTTN